MRKSTITRLLPYVLLPLVFLIIVYLLCGFVYMEFDPVKMARDDRAIIALFGGCMIFLGLFVAMISDNKNEIT